VVDSRRVTLERRAPAGQSTAMLVFMFCSLPVGVTPQEPKQSVTRSWSRSRSRLLDRWSGDAAMPRCGPRLHDYTHNSCDRDLALLVSQVPRSLSGVGARPLLAVGPR
jgi:hypothetical protein